MKTLLSLLFFLFLILSTKAQGPPAQFLVSYQVYPKVGDDLPDEVYPVKTGLLYIKEQTAVFWLDQEPAYFALQGHARYSSIILAKFLPAKWLLSHTAKFYQNPSYQWTITAKRKQIGPYYCQMAQSLVGNQQVVAWFSREIPFGYGPSIFQGLPGLIIELKVEGGRSYYFSGIAKR